MKFDMVRPCLRCPFRTDIPGYLSAARVREIGASLDGGTFPCHNTVDYENGWGDDQESEEYTPSGNEVHCAGALILLERLSRPSQMMRIAERLGFYDRRKLDMNAPVYKSIGAMAKAQPRRGR